jgi:1-deoxy-D-xylulose-5-phosphate reductoisomerase
VKRRVIILGSTGSIGRSTLDVLARLRDEWEVVALAARSNVAMLSSQAAAFRPEAVAISDGAAESSLDSALLDGVTVFQGDGALVQLVDSVACDCVVCAVVGMSGLRATMRAVELGRRVALANKEALVTAGSLLVPLAERTGAAIIPVDSEHSAIFQVLDGRRGEEVGRVFLTASGGPFRTLSPAAMDEVTVEEALKHPTWNMGPKITIDSATMMNKALEIVEAHWLFRLSAEQIQVVVHPESIIHSIVEFIDGSMIAQLGTPDMRTPIQYALTYPARRPCPSKRLNLIEAGQLNLLAPDGERFPALRLGYEAVRRGGTSGAVLNAANEAAVCLFREGAIGFCDIARYTEQALRQHAFIAEPTLDELLTADQWARDEVARCMLC